MNFDEILYRTEDSVAWITLNRPERLNAWTAVMDREIRAATQQALEDENVRVIVLTGAGRGFCSGADVQGMGELFAGAADQPISATLREQFDPDPLRYAWFPSLNKPVIGAINGPTAGLGFVIALYCDIRLASSAATFTTAFAKRGLIAEYGIAWMLSRLAGHAAALDLLLSSRKVTAEEAFALRLVNRVIPQEDFEREVRAYAMELAHAVSPRSLRVMKRQIYNSLSQTLAQACTEADDEMFHSFDCEDFREGVRHFLEKRQSRFSGKQSFTMTITSKASCRVDMAGGTLDIWPLYLFLRGAVTLNFGITRYATCTIRTRKDKRLAFASRDLKLTETFDSLRQLESSPRFKLPLLAHLVRYFAPETGIEIDTDSEAPAGAGIAGSSTLIIAVASALNRLTGRKLPIEKLREVSQNIEAQIIRVPTGAQDYYPAMYGGVLAIELSVEGIHAVPLPVPAEELNRRFVLAYTGVPRNSGINNWEVTKAYIDGDRKVHKNFDRIASIAIGMRAAIEKQQWADAGRLLREEWANRRKNAPGITTSLIDKLVEVTRRNGALGAKVCGAGGGGCVFFLTEPESQHRVAKAITDAGAQVLPCKVAEGGVKVKTL